MHQQQQGCSEGVIDAEGGEEEEEGSAWCGACDNEAEGEQEERDVEVARSVQGERGANFKPVRAEQKKIF